MKELYSALVQAQAEFEDVHKDAPLAHLKINYASYSNMINTTRPILKKYGFAVVQLLDSKDGQQYLITRLCHSSGKSIDSWVKIIPEKPDLKSFGGALTYLKRYSYATLLCLATTDEDPDSIQGEDIVDRGEFITDKQLGLLKFKLNGVAPSFTAELTKKFGSLDKVLFKDFNAILTWIEGAKQ